MPLQIRVQRPKTVGWEILKQNERTKTTRVIVGHASGWYVMKNNYSSQIFHEKNTWDDKIAARSGNSGRMFLVTL